MLVTALQRSPGKDRALWQCEFERQDRADFVMEQIGPRQWDGVRVVQPPDEPAYPIIPQESWEPDPQEEVEYEQTMRGTVLKRLRHGIGRERGLGFREGSKVQAAGMQRRSVGDKLPVGEEEEDVGGGEDEDDDQGPSSDGDIRCDGHIR